MPPIKRNEDEFRMEITNAARKLFMIYGFQKTTMEDIAKEIRKAKSTIYYYYDSKDEVFIDVIGSEIEGLIAKVKSQINVLPSASERFSCYYSIISNETTNLSNLYSVLLDELKYNTVMQYEIEKVYVNKDIFFLEEILLEGIEKREFKSITKQNVGDVAFLISAMNRTLIHTFFLKKKSMDLQKYVSLLGDLILNGVK